jgi:PAS domain S-box-containing protein
MRVAKFETFENLDNYLNNCSACLHAVDENGIITWANETELKYMGYSEDEYIGKFIGDFHLDRDVVDDILGKLTRFETVNAYPARMRRKDGSIAYVTINSNVYKDKRGGFEHTRCFTTSVGKVAFEAMKN